MSSVKSELSLIARNWLKEVVELPYNGQFTEDNEGELIFYDHPDDDKKRSLAYMRYQYLTNKDGYLGIGVSASAHYPPHQGTTFRKIFWGNDRDDEEHPQATSEEHADTLLRFLHSSPLGDSEYLNRKKIDDVHGIMYEETPQGEVNVLVPIRDIFDRLLSIQVISPSGKKDNPKGLGTKGGFFVFGQLKDEANVYLAEGFATAYSVNAATDDVTICCFGGGGLQEVGKSLLARYPKINIQIAGDLGVAGKKYAEDAGKLFNCPIYFPPYHKSDTDFNDTYVRIGVEETRKFLKPPEFRAIDINDFLARDIPPVEFIIDDLFPKNELHLILGPAGIGKSWLSYELAICIASGVSYLGYNPSKPMRCLYIDAEMRDAQIASRFKEIAKRLKVQLKDIRMISNDYFEETKQPNIDLYLKTHLDMLGSEFEKSDVIFMDNLTALTGVGPSEDWANKKESWIPIRDFCNKWRSKGKTIFLVHHTNKAGGSAGTSALNRSTGTELLLTDYLGTKINDPSIILNALTIQFPKGRDIPFACKQPLHCRIMKGDPNSYWEIESKGRPMPSQGDGFVREEQQPASQEYVLLTMLENGASREDILDIMKIDIKKFYILCRNSEVRILELLKQRSLTSEECFEFMGTSKPAYNRRRKDEVQDAEA